MSEKSARAEPRNGGKLLGIAFIVLFVVVCVAGLVGYLGFRSKPGHWTEQHERIEQMSDADRDAVSTTLMNDLLNQWSEGPPNATSIEDLIGQRTTMRIPFDDLNIWLAQEGIGLLDDVGVQLPDEVKGAMVDSPGDGLLRLSCMVEAAESEQVISLSFEIEIQEDGTVVSKLAGAQAGLLPIPKSKAIEMIAKQAKQTEHGDRLLALFQGTPVDPIDIPIDPTDDGLRDGRLIGLQVQDDALVVTREAVRRTKQ